MQNDEAKPEATTKPEEKMARTFPVLRGNRHKDKPESTVTAVPWAMVEPHEEQAQKNHGQSLEVLASRGGLSACELVLVLEGKPLFPFTMKREDGEKRLAELLQAFNEATAAAPAPTPAPPTGEAPRAELPAAVLEHAIDEARGTTERAIAEALPPVDHASKEG